MVAVVIACNRERGVVKEEHKISADNPNNPFDYVGQYHNETILTLVKDGKTRGASGKFVVPSIQETYSVCLKVLAKHGRFIGTRTDAELPNDSEAQIANLIDTILVYLNMDGGYVNYINRLDMGEATKQQLIELFTGFQDMIYTSYSDVMEYITDFQDTYLSSLASIHSNPKIFISDDMYVLTAASAMAHSLELWSDMALLRDIGVLDEFNSDNIDIDEFMNNTNDPQYAGFWRKLLDFLVFVVECDVAGVIGGAGIGAIGGNSWQSTLTGMWFVGAATSITAIIAEI